MKTMKNDPLACSPDTDSARRWLFAIAVIAALAIVCPSAASAAPATGQWTGTTSQGKAFSFVIDANGLISSITYTAAYCPTCTDTTATHFFYPPDLTITNNTFSASSVGTCPSRKVDGTFQSTTSASGTITLTATSSFSCFLSGTTQITWTATTAGSGGGNVVITTQPANQTIASGQTATLSVVATGTAPLSYQWHIGASGTTTSPITGATSSNYTTPALTSTTSYWVRVSNSGSSADSTTATVTVGSAGAGFVVNSTLDALDNNRGDGICATAGAVCTLRAAIQEANALTGARVITLPAGTYTFTLAGRDETSAASGDLNIASGKDITINGGGAASTIIDANGLDRAFQSFGGQLTLNDVTVRNGNSATSFGGCFYMSASLTLNRVVVTGCNSGTNSGAGIIVFGSSSAPSTLTLTDTTIAQNTTTGIGGGIYLSSNTVGTITRTTVSGNTASNGAGLQLFGSAGSPSSVTLSNTTFSGNTATAWGGAMYFSGETGSAANLTNVTVASNSSGNGGGALTVTGVGQFQIRNTIVANSAGSAPANCFAVVGGVITSLGNNLEFPGTSCGFNLAGDRRANPLLGALATNGGLTQTHSLGAGSPAIDLGDAATCAASPVSGVDQRGRTRPASCDAGAYEFGALGTGPTMSVDKTALFFAAVSDGASFTSRTSSQAVRLTQSGAGTVTWTATSNSPWLTVSPASGSGSAALTIAVEFAGGLAAAQSGAITLTFAGAANDSTTITATLNLATGTVMPFGGFDTPTDGSTVTGSIAVTGWALDNMEVARVQIQRDAHPNDPPGAAVNGRVFVGDASFVEGARPDVETGNPSVPLNSRGGWGYLMLTRGLIWDGKGPFKLYALATDKEGNTVTLGSKTLTVNNAAATKPFGAIDAPGPGATVSGVFPTTGWVLTPNAGATIPATGVQVAIDGVFVPGVPSVSDRPDITAGFTGFPTAGAGRGLFVDSTQYTNGTHVLGWLVTDSTGQADGVGSRFITVSNGSFVASETLSRLADVDAVPFKGAGSRRVLKVEELDRIEISLDEDADGSYLGYMRIGDRLAPLPIGSRVERRTFTWQLAAGFLGRYDLVFIRERDGVRVQRQDVRITVHPQGTLSRPQVVIDTPAREQVVDDGFRLTGWALDPAAPYSTGMSTVHVWAYPVRGSAPIFIGGATPARRRQDVAAIYGERFQASGFELEVSGLRPGTYDLAVFAWSDGAGAFLPAKVIRVTVR
jgi:CSLREA domain-containing protein